MLYIGQKLLLNKRILFTLDGVVWHNLIIVKAEFF